MRSVTRVYLSLCLLLPFTPAYAQDAGAAARSAADAARSAAAKAQSVTTATKTTPPKAVSRDSTVAAPAGSSGAIDRLGVPGPVTVAGRTYALAWSSNPGPQLYKQEYVPAGQQVETYRDMLVIDVRPGTANARTTAATMARMIEQRKASDPFANYELLIDKQTTGMVLDFLLADRDANGQRIMEWNLYRYEDTPDGKGSIMVGISRRAYGDTQARAMLSTLKEQRVRDRDVLVALELPLKMPAAR